MGSTARPVTPNVFILEKGKTPVTSPARAVKTGPSCGPFSRRARNSPSSITNIVSAGVSSFTVMPPTSVRRSSDWETNHSKSACPWSAKAGTLRNSAIRAEMCDGSVVPLIRAPLELRLRSLDLGQILVHELYDNTAIAHHRRRNIDGTGPALADHLTSRTI